MTMVESRLFICMGCESQSQDGIGWVYFNFKFLESGWLCVACGYQYGEDFTLKQLAGL